MLYVPIAIPTFSSALRNMSRASFPISGKRSLLAMAGTRRCAYISACRALSVSIRWVLVV